MRPTSRASGRASCRRQPHHLGGREGQGKWRGEEHCNAEMGLPVDLAHGLSGRDSSSEAVCRCVTCRSPFFLFFHVLNR